MKAYAAYDGITNYFMLRIDYGRYSLEWHDLESIEDVNALAGDLTIHWR